MKKIILISFLCLIASVVYSQRTTITDKAIVNNEMKLGGKIAKGISSDSVFTSPNHDSLSTQKAIYDFVTRTVEDSTSNLPTGSGTVNYLTVWTGVNQIGNSSIYQDGSNNFGFGTALPTTRVDINGGLRVRSITQDDTIDSVMVADGTGRVYWRNAATVGALFGSGAANKVVYWTGANTLSYNSNLHWDNTNIRLGIGTSSPTYSLHTYGTSGFIRNLIESADANNGAQLRVLNDVGDFGAFNVYGTTFTFPYLQGESSFSGSNGLHFISNVGVLSGGTDDIFFRVGGVEDIDFKMTYDGGLVLTPVSAAPTGSEGMIYQNSSDKRLYVHDGTQFRSFVFGAGAAGQIAYWSSSKNTTGENSFFWDATNKRLGIGTSSPSKAIDIIGSGPGSTLRVEDNGTGDAAMSMYIDGLTDAWSFFTKRADKSFNIREVYTSNALINNDRVTIKQGGDIEFTGSGGLQLHTGTTAQRPTGAAGKFRYNTTIGGLEYHNGSTWNTISTTTGTITGATNLGTGLGLFSAVNGANLEFKSIKAGLNMLITSDATSMTFTPQNDIYQVDGTLGENRSLTLDGYAFNIRNEAISLDSFFNATFQQPSFNGSRFPTNLLFYGSNLLDTDTWTQVSYDRDNILFDFGADLYGLRYKNKGSSNYASVVEGTPLMMHMGTNPDDYVIDYANGYLQLGSQSASPTGQLGAIHVDSDDGKLKFHDGDEWRDVQFESSFGELYYFAVTDSIQLPVSSQQRITGLTSGSLRNFTATDSTLTYTSPQTEYFKIDYTGDIAFLDGTGDGATILFYVKKNDVVDVKSRNNISRINESSVNEKQPFGKSFIIQLAEDDVIDWWVSGNMNIKLEDININITQL